MNPIQTHLESEGIDITVDDAVDIRLRQYYPGHNVIQERKRGAIRGLIERALEHADVTADMEDV